MKVFRSKNKSNKGLSIRLRQGGQSFYEPLPNACDTQSVRVVVEGVDCVPYPRALTEELDLVSVAQSAGVCFDENDRLVVADEEGLVNYLLRVEADTITTLFEWADRTQTRLLFTTPLATSVRRAVVGGRRSKTLVLQFGTEEVYAAMATEHKLQFADVLPVANEEQLLQHLAQLNADFDLRKTDIFVSGVEGKAKTKLLGKYFRHCKWEQEGSDVYIK